MTVRFEGYEPLIAVLHDALVQAAEGKGKHRHGNGEPFAKQPIGEITEAFGIGFPLGQATKKSKEAIGMIVRGERDAARRELLGAIVYTAAAIMALDASGEAA